MKILVTQSYKWVIAEQDVETFLRSIGEKVYDEIASIAVESENDLALRLDVWRSFFCNKNFCNKNCPDVQLTVYIDLTTLVSPGD